MASYSALPRKPLHPIEFRFAVQQRFTTEPWSSTMWKATRRCTSTNVI